MTPPTRKILIAVAVAALAIAGIAVALFGASRSAPEPAAITTVSTSTAAASVSAPGAYRVYFANDLLDPQVSCNKAFPVTRHTDRTDILRTAIEDLLRGPSDSDTIAGFKTAIPAGVTLRSAKVDGGVAYLDFDSKLDQVAGSCRVNEIRAQIERTAEDAAGVGSVRISVEGRTDDILQP